MTKRIGSQFPSKLVTLDYKKTRASEAIGLYEKSKRKVFEWQKNILDPLMAINDDGLWTHSKFGYAVPRQNGKNEVVAIRELWGLVNGEKILHTAHRVPTSSSAWERLCNIIESAGFVEDKDYKKWAQKGLEKITLFKGGTISFRTRTNTGGLGESFDILIIDEAQEYTQDELSAIKYTIAASDNPQTIMTGTPPTLVSAGTVFPNYRKKTLAKENYNSGWAEWSVDHFSDVHDVEIWYQSNPSLGLMINERTIQDEIGDDDLDFNIQRLGYWYEYNQKSEISKEEWEKQKIYTFPVFEGPLHVGIKFGQDGKNVSMAIAVKTISDRIYVEVIDCISVRNGNYWIVDFLKYADVASIVIDGASGQYLLKNELIDYGIDESKIILPKVKDIVSANFKFTQGIYQDVILHSGQPSLTAVVTNCVKRNIGSSGGFGFKSLYEDKDISLMDSIILAYWACSEIKVKKKSKQKVSY